MVASAAYPSLDTGFSNLYISKMCDYKTSMLEGKGIWRHSVGTGIQWLSPNCHSHYLLCLHQTLPSRLLISKVPTNLLKYICTANDRLIILNIAFGKI